MDSNMLNALYDGYEKNGWWDKKTHSERLHEQVLIRGNKTAIVDMNGSITFAKLERDSDRLAAYFLSCGIRKGDRIVLQHVNVISFAVICFALFRIGAIPVLAMPAHRETEVSAIIGNSGAVGYIAIRSYHGFDYTALAEKMLAKHSLKHFWYADEIEALDLGKYELSNMKFDKPSSRDCAMFVLSGGSTGIPKLIPRIHASFLHEQDCCAKAFGVDSEMKVLIAMPLTHAWNLCGPGLFGSLLNGATAVLAYNGSADEILRLMNDHRITHAGLVPSLIMACIQIIELVGGYDLSSLCSIQIGGSMSTRQLMESAFSTFGCTIQQAYGMSEGLVCGTSPDDDIDTLLTAHGHPVSEGDTLVILDENDEPLPVGEVGQIAARGPCVFTGYYNNKSANERAFTHDGFYKTGDKGRIIPENGCLQVMGRTQEQINRLGEKIMPSELEDLLVNCCWIDEAYVVPASDELLIQRICVFAKVNDKSADLKKLRDYLRSCSVADFKLPDQFEIVDEFPYTAVGKVDKKALTAIAEQRK
jgi:2,3-dihydroxybenzoate-AMP ligase